MTPTTSEREAQFQAWWRASKYCQVAYGDHEQVARDAWQAALTREQREGVFDFQTAVAVLVGADEEDQADILDHIRAWVFAAKLPRLQQEAPGAVAWRCVNGYSDCFGPQGRKCCPDCQYRTTTPAPVDVRDPATLARRFHETYERLAPRFGYETRAETRVFDPESANGKLMIATCAALLDGQQAGVDAFGAQRLLDWNRAQANPPIVIGMEYAVYQAALNGGTTPQPRTP